MSNGIVLTVNLVGKLGKSIIKEENVQNRHGELLITKHIAYLGKEESKCVRKTNIAGEVVDGWIGGKSPFFIKEFIWKNMSKPQRLKAWIERFDEGFGVQYQEL
jgi:hypothetical protein